MTTESNRKTKVTSAQGMSQQFQLMQDQEEFIKELIRYIPEGARAKFRELKPLRPSNVWNKALLEDLKTLANAAYLVEFYQEKELKFAERDMLDEAAKAQRLVVSNSAVVKRYMLHLQLTAASQYKEDIRDWAPSLEAEKGLSTLVNRPGSQDDEDDSNNQISLYA